MKQIILKVKDVFVTLDGPEESIQTGLEAAGYIAGVAFIISVMIFMCIVLGVVQ